MKDKKRSFDFKGLVIFVIIGGVFYLVLSATFAHQNYQDCVDTSDNNATVQDIKSMVYEDFSPVTYVYQTDKGEVTTIQRANIGEDIALGCD